jgi:TolA-binding protein
VAYYNLGYCFFKAEEYTQAKNYFNQYLSAESNDESPRATDAVLRAADCNFALKSYATAQTGYDQVIRKNASEADYAYYQKGIIQGLQGNSEGKISTMRSLVSNFRKSAYIDDAFYSIGETHMNNGNFQQAIKEYQALNRDYPKNPYFIVAQLNIGQSYINVGQPNTAIPLLKRIVSTYPSTSEARTAMRFIQNSYKERGMTDSLDAFYSSLPTGFALTPNAQDSILFTSALSNVKREDCAATITSMQKYLSKYPNGYFAVDASYYLAKCYYEKPSPTKAQQYYNFVIARSPNQYMEQSLANSAQLYENDKDYTMAAKRYEQLEEIATKKDLTIYALQGELKSNFNLNDYQKTLDIGNKILSLGYTDGDLKTSAQFYMGKSYMALNQEENAMASFTQVMKANDAEMGAEANYEVAHIYFMQEKYEDSRKSVMALKDNYDGYNYWRAKAFILLADIYVKDGDTFQAKSTLQSIIDKYSPKDDGIVEAAKEKLEEIKANETGK